MTDARMDHLAWKAAADLLLPDKPGGIGSVRYALLALAGKVSPSHQAVQLLQAHLAHLQGHRGRLSTGELAPVRARARLH